MSDQIVILRRWCFPFVFGAKIFEKRHLDRFTAELQTTHSLRGFYSSSHWQIDTWENQFTNEILIIQHKIKGSHQVS